MNKVRELLEIERTVVMKAPRSRVWKALTSAREFASWFGVEFDGEFALGATLQMVTTHPDYAGIRFPVFIERIEPEVRFAWRWFPGGSNPERTDKAQTTLVTFTLEDVAGGTRVTVHETEFDRVKLAERAKAYEDNVGGWEGQLANLTRHVEA
jgi:uncharacterized protein YndB with AHSA1/START domain